MAEVAVLIRQSIMTRTCCFAILFFHVVMVLQVCGNGENVDFPPMLDSDDISYFFQNQDLDGLHWALSNVFARSERNPNPQFVKEPLPQTLIARGGGSTYTSAYKLKADLEQAQYLASHLTGKEADFFRDIVAPVYESVIQNIPPLEDLKRTHGLYQFRQHDIEAGISEVYNKALHQTKIDEFDSEGNPIPIINKGLDLKRIEREWFGEEDGTGQSHPGVVVVDDILSQEALTRIRKVLLESTVWYQTKMPLKFGGYVGAYIDDGLHDRILLKLAFELHRTLPRIMKDHPLKYLWAYKYDSDYTGINTHADQAAVNVNLWITPDEANLDTESGGLVIFTAKPPEDWDFERYNTDTEFVIQELIQPSNYANITVPHKQNRAVIFDSALFHHTDKYHFRKGYENRRINLTLLYGNMQLGNKDEKGRQTIPEQEL